MWSLGTFSELSKDANPVGRMMFHVIGAMAESERELIRERVKAGPCSRCKVDLRPMFANAVRLVLFGLGLLGLCSRMLA